MPSFLAEKDRGRTLLHHAARCGKSDTVTELLQRGADATVRSGDLSGRLSIMLQGKGATPADLARKHGHEDLANTLQAAKNRQQTRTEAEQPKVQTTDRAPTLTQGSPGEAKMQEGALNEGSEHSSTTKFREQVTNSRLVSPNYVKG